MTVTLSGKTALIAGASKRIGNALARGLAEKGVHVVIHYSSSAKDAKQLCEELKAFKVNAWTIKADFKNPSEYETLIQRAMKIAGPLDILINNASFFSSDQTGNMIFAGLMQQIEINAWAPFVLSREFERQQRGSIINILDAKITGYDREHVSYLLSKQMFATLTKMSALDFAPAVRVNGIAPGLILSPAGKDEKYLKNLAKSVPLKRSGNPEDIVSAAIYLLTNDFLTGQILFVDGGRHITEENLGQNTYQ